MTPKQIKKMLLLNLEEKQVKAFEQKTRRTCQRSPLCPSNRVYRATEAEAERTPNR